MLLVPGHLQRLVDHQLAQPVDLEAVELGEPGRPLDARGPDDQVGREKIAAAGVDALGGDLADLLAGVDLHIQRLELARGRDLQPLGQRRQHARRRLDQPDLDAPVGIEPAQAVAHQLAAGMAQLGGELDAGGAGADDRDLQPARARGAGLAVAAQELAEHALLDPLGLRQAVEIEAVLGDARHTKVVQHAADRDHQGVVAETLRRHDLGAAGIVDRLEQDFARAAIEAGHAAELEGEVMPARVHQIVEAVGSGLQRARGDLVQQRLPDVRQHAVHERDPRLAAPAEPIAELGREDQAAGTAADDDDVVRHGDAGAAACSIVGLAAEQLGTAAIGSRASVVATGMRFGAIDVGMGRPHDLSSHHI